MLSLTVLLAFAIFAQQSFANEPESIVGGQPAAPGEFPYQCSLNEYGGQFCGCSILNPNQVLTAAHCVADRDTDFSVRTGSISSTRGEPHSIKTIRIHSGYDPSNSWINDVAVLTLQTPIEYNDYTKPIALASSEPIAGTVCVFSGWGRTTQTYPENLLKMTTAIVEKSQCQKNISITLYPSQVCALKTAGIGACYGDSGGPLVCNGQQVGIASFVLPCALGVPDVFNSVYHQRDFIEQAKQDI